MLHQKIFNRWGQLIFESFDPSIMWKGNFDGRPVAPGVYFIDVKATNTFSITPVTYQGAIHVMD
ncbi:MAG: gliding motility-associated C-terminal domain-containing protein, partial [Crocinitomicaceae bacterium]